MILPRRGHGTANSAIWTSLIVDQAQLRAAWSIVRTALNEGDDPGLALQEAVEWVAPVWVTEGEVDWAWLAERMAVQHKPPSSPYSQRR